MDILQKVILFQYGRYLIGRIIRLRIHRLCHGQSIFDSLTMTIDIVGDNKSSLGMIELLRNIADSQLLAVFGVGIKTRRMEVKGLSLEISYLQTSIGLNLNGFALGDTNAIINGL